MLEPKEVPPPTTNMGREGIQLMKRLKLPMGNPQRLTPEKLAVVLMTDMETKYPNQGWAREGHRLAMGMEKMREAMNAKTE